MTTTPAIRPGTTLTSEAPDGQTSFLTVVDRSEHIPGAWNCLLVRGEPHEVVLSDRLLRETASASSKPCGANTPATWGELFLMLEERPHDLRDAVLEKIMRIDAELPA